MVKVVWGPGQVTPGGFLTGNLTSAGCLCSGLRGTMEHPTKNTISGFDRFAENDVSVCVCVCALGRRDARLQIHDSLFSGCSCVLHFFRLLMCKK